MCKNLILILSLLICMNVFAKDNVKWKFYVMKTANELSTKGNIQKGFKIWENYLRRATKASEKINSLLLKGQISKKKKKAIIKDANLTEKQYKLLLESKNQLTDFYLINPTKYKRCKRLRGEKFLHNYAKCLNGAYTKYLEEMEKIKKQQKAKKDKRRKEYNCQVSEGDEIFQCPNGKLYQRVKETNEEATSDPKLNNLEQIRDYVGSNPVDTQSIHKGFHQKLNIVEDPNNTQRPPKVILKD